MVVRLLAHLLPKTAGIGSNMLRDPCEDKRTKKWMDGYVYIDKEKNVG